MILYSLGLTKFNFGDFKYYVYVTRRDSIK